MFRYVYTVVLYLLQPLIWLFFLYRSIKDKNYRQRITERYGIYHKTSKTLKNGIVLHAASVGEVMAAVPLIKALLQQYPHLPLTITTFTPTGSARVKAIFADQVNHCYLPFDLVGSVQRFLNHFEPQLFLIIETELWLNLIYGLQQRKIPTLLVNARLSARSVKRYAKFPTLLNTLWRGITHISAQDQVSAERFLSLGYPIQQLSCSGNLKYDLQLDPTIIQASQTLKRQWLTTDTTSRPCWVATSTHSGEEEIILAAFQRLRLNYPNLLLILIPRHLECFIEVEQLIKNNKLCYLTRTSQQAPQADTAIMLIDTMGEVALFYGIADLAFIGGSLIPRGGHNPLEAAIWQLPIISGSHTFNFPDIFTLLEQTGGVMRINADINQPEQASIQLENAVMQLLNSIPLRQNMGLAAFQVLEKNRGAVQRTLQLIQNYLPVQP